MAFRRDGSLPLPPMRDQLVILRPPAEPIQNSYGEQVGEYENVGVIWANVSALQGRDLKQVEEKIGVTPFRVRTRYLPFNVKVGWRFLWYDSTLEVVDAEDPAGMRRDLTIYCREVDL